MECNLIFKIWWKNSLAGKLLQLHHEFLPRLYHKFGVEICIEMVMDGMLVFFKSMGDFVKFHQLSEVVSLPERLFPSSSPRKKNGNVELFVELVKLPPQVTIDDLLPGVATCYQIVSKEIEVEKLSESSAVIRYIDVQTFEGVFDFLKEIWDQNTVPSQIIPKREEVRRVFNKVPLQ